MIRISIEGCPHDNSLLFQNEEIQDDFPETGSHFCTNTQRSIIYKIQAGENKIKGNCLDCPLTTAEK